MALTETETLALLKTIFAVQQDDGSVFDISFERIAEIANGSKPTKEETAVLLRSPLAREELVIQLRLHDLREAEKQSGT